MLLPLSQMVLFTVGEARARLPTVQTSCERTLPPSFTVLSQMLLSSGPGRAQPQRTRLQNETEVRAGNRPAQPVGGRPSGILGSSSVPWVRVQAVGSDSLGPTNQSDTFLNLYSFKGGIEFPIFKNGKTLF